MPSITRFVAEPGIDPRGLLDDLAYTFAAIGGAQLAQMAQSADLRAALLAGHASVILPGALLAPWCPPEALPTDIGVTLLWREDQRWSTDINEPSEMIEDRGRQAELILTEMPTGSGDLGRLLPVVSYAAQQRDDPAQWQSETRGELTIWRMPSGWAVVPDVASPSIRYGIGD